MLRHASAGEQVQNFQSDRWWPPFFSFMSRSERWHDPGSGVERFRTEGVSSGTGPFQRGAMLPTRDPTFTVAGDSLVPEPRFHGDLIRTRRLNPWAVASGATVLSHQASAEFLSTVVERRWDFRPDLLEPKRRSGASVPFRFVGVRDSL